MFVQVDDILYILIGRDNLSKGRGIKLILPLFIAILSILGKFAFNVFQNIYAELIAGFFFFLPKALDVYGWYKQALKIMKTNPLAGKY